MGLIAFFATRPSEVVMIDTAATAPSKFQSVANLPTIQGKVANGNSVFAKNIMEVMQPQDLQLYSEHFYHAMQDVPSGVSYQWLLNNQFFGRVTAQAPHKSKSGVYCRHFEELLSYYGKHQRFVGMSCQRRAGGWCKLRANSAKTCELGKPGSFDLWWKSISLF